MRIRIAVFCVSLATCAMAVAATQKAGSSAAQHRRPLAAQHADGGFWRTDHGFRSQLVLTNVLITSELVVTPVLYMADGTRYALNPVTISKSGVARVDINESLSSAPAAVRPHISEYGSASIEYVWRWQAITATVNCLDVARSLVFTSSLAGPKVAARTGSAQNSASASRHVVEEGLWWRRDPAVGGFIALMNTTENKVPVHVRIFPSSRRGHPGGEESWDEDLRHLAVDLDVNVPSHETKLVDLTSALSHFDQSLTAGGITVSYNGSTSEIAVAGGLQNSAIGYSARIPFLTRPRSPDSETFKSAAVGLMVGPTDPMMMFPEGTIFVPYGVVRNIGDKVAAVTPTINYEKNGQIVNRELGTFDLRPNETEVLDLEAALGELGLKSFSGTINLILSSTAHFGEIMFSAGSVDRTGTYVFEVRCNGFSRTSKILFGEWSTADGNDTMINLWNAKNADQDLILNLYYDGGSYKYPIHLAKGQSFMINASEIVGTAIADSSGSIMPRSAQSGSAVLSEANSDEMQVGTSYGIYNTRTATCRDLCGQCNIYTDFFTNPFSWTILVGDEIDVTTTADFQDGSVVDETIHSQWRSSNSSIAGNTENRYTAVSPGTFTAIAIANLEDGTCDDNERYCQFVPTQADGGQGAVIPSLSSISPAQGLIGTAVSNITINGNGLSGASINAGSGITATVNSSSSTQIQATFTISSTAPGGNHSVSVTVNGQSSSASVNFFVQIPTSLSIVAGTDSTTSESSCSAGAGNTGCGVARAFTYQVRDQANQAIQVAGIQVWDSIATTSPNNLGLTGYTTTCTFAGLTNSGPCNVTTNSSGQFMEQGLSACSTVCRPTNACVTGGPTNANQTAHVGSAIIVQSIGYYCDHITVNGS